MGKQTFYLMWIPVVFIVLIIHSIITIPVDDIEFTGELIDKQIDQMTSDTYFVVRNDTINRVGVDLDLYYSHEIGDIVTVEYPDPNPSTDEAFFLSVVYTVGFSISMLLIMFIDRFYKKIPKETSSDGK